MNNETNNRFSFFYPGSSWGDDNTIYYGRTDGTFTTERPSGAEQSRGSTGELEYSLSTNKRLREKILQHAPEGTKPLPLISYLEKQTEVVQQVLRRGQDQGVFHAALLKVFNKDFLNKVTDAMVFEVLLTPAETLQRDTTEMLTNILLESMDEDTMAALMPMVEQMSAGEDVRSVIEAHTPITSSLAHLFERLQVVAERASVNREYREKYPKVSAVLDSIKDALTAFLSSASRQISNWGDVEEQGFHPAAVEEKVQKSITQLVIDTNEVISMHPECDGILLKALEIHQALTEALHKESRGEDNNLKHFNREAIVIHHTLYNHAIMEHTAALVDRKYPDEERADLSSIALCA